MWLVTTEGELADDYERSEHANTMWASQDYSGRILELEIDGYEQTDEESTRYGRRWVANLSRGIERINVTIERVAQTSRFLRNSRHSRRRRLRCRPPAGSSAPPGRTRLAPSICTGQNTDCVAKRAAPMWSEQPSGACQPQQAMPGREVSGLPRLDRVKVVRGERAGIPIVGPAVPEAETDSHGSSPQKAAAAPLGSVVEDAESRLGPDTATALIGPLR